MGCLAVCPKKAISAVEGADGHRYIQVNPEACVECGLCEKKCPVVNGTRYGEESLSSSFYAGWAEDAEIRDRGATSGAFGAIAKKVLYDGGAVVGTVMEGDRCIYRMIESADQLSQIQGSKYTASDPGRIYEDVIRVLREGRKVLFAGLPCHVAACLSYVPDSLKDNLYTIDLVCGGVSSPKLLKIFRANSPGFDRVISFRDKQEGWRPQGYRYNLRYALKNGEIAEQPRGSRNLITDGFACELTDRYSCYHCRFAFPSRKSDITLGDLWGDKVFTDQHSRGVSLIMAHSEKGRELLQQANLALRDTDPIEALRHNRRVFFGDSIKGAFPERRWLGWLSEVLPYSAIKRIYASDLHTKNPLWWPIAAYRLISFQIAEKISNRRSSKILNNLKSRSDS